MKDYIPSNDGDLITWAQNFNVKIAGYASLLGLTTSDVTASQKACGDIDKGINDAVQAAAAAQKATKTKVTTVKTSTDVLRVLIQRAKKAEGYTADIGEDLKIIGTDDPVDPNTYKTTLSATVFPGRVTIKFTKKGVQGVNIYSKLKGNEKWEKLAFDSYSPYEDNRPLHVAGTAEVRQYMAIGVMHDQEIGQMSDIVEATFGG